MEGLFFCLLGLIFTYYDFIYVAFRNISIIVLANYAKFGGNMETEKKDQAEDIQKSSSKYNFEVVEAGYIPKTLRLCYILANNLCIPDDAIRRFNLEKSTFVQMLYDRNSKIIGLNFHEGKLEASMSGYSPLEKNKKKITFFSIAGFFANEKIDPERKPLYMDFVECEGSPATFLLDFGKRWEKGNSKK